MRNPIFILEYRIHLYKKGYTLLGSSSVKIIFPPFWKRAYSKWIEFAPLRRKILSFYSWSIFNQSINQSINTKWGHSCLSSRKWPETYQVYRLLFRIWRERRGQTVQIQIKRHIWANRSDPAHAPQKLSYSFWFELYRWTVLGQVPIIYLLPLNVKQIIYGLQNICKCMEQLRKPPRQSISLVVKV